MLKSTLEQYLRMIYKYYFNTRADIIVQLLETAESLNTKFLLQFPAII